MEGRIKWTIAAAILCGLSGCQFFEKSTPTTSYLPNGISPKDLPPVPAETQSKRRIDPGLEDHADASKDGPISTNTIIVFANTWVESVARDPGMSPPEREQKLTQARLKYVEVLEREPRNVDAFIGLARMYQVTGELDKLTQIEAKMKSTNADNPKVWNWIAVRQAQVKDYEGAAESYHQAVKLDPNNRMTRMHLGFTLARARRYEEGYEWLKKSMREPDARANLAKMMVHNGDVDQARQQVKYSLQVDPNHAATLQVASALDAGSSPTLPGKVGEEPVRRVNYTETAPAPAINRVPQEPSPIGSSRTPTPNTSYVPTSGWDGAPGK